MDENTGIFLLDKAENMTSFLACAVARRLLNVKKIGHAGTLDPNATGVLPLLLGRATKFLDYLPCHDKRYTAQMRFGAVSDTLDCWGTVTSTGKPAPSLEEIERILPLFRGDIRQIPPMTSALKQNGERLYDLARQGIEVEREPRPVTVYALDIVAYDRKAGVLTLDCACSKGTYIRSLCDDIGTRLGCGAVMTALRRTEAVGFSLAKCVTLDEMRAMTPAQLQERIIPLHEVFAGLPQVTVSQGQAKRFQNGGALALERLPSRVEGLTRVMAPDGSWLGLGLPKDGELKVEKGV